jgi:hypothetical protein
VTSASTQLEHGALTRRVLATSPQAGSSSGAFVYNRRFRNTPYGDVIGHIREMVFAARM